jgi:hypothetical protein
MLVVQREAGSSTHIVVPIIYRIGGHTTGERKSNTDRSMSALAICLQSRIAPVLRTWNLISRLE